MNGYAKRWGFTVGIVEWNFKYLRTFVGAKMNDMNSQDSSFFSSVLVYNFFIHNLIETRLKYIVLLFKINETVILLLLFVSVF